MHGSMQSGLLCAEELCAASAFALKRSARRAGGAPRALGGPAAGHQGPTRRRPARLLNAAARFRLQRGGGATAAAANFPPPLQTSTPPTPTHTP
jgi:hypothetical protein